MDAPGLAGVYGDLRADYQAARASRFRRTRTGFPWSGSSADYHYRVESDYLRLLEYARAMDRDDVVIGQMIDRAVQETVGDGFVLDVQTGDDAVDRDLNAAWDAWCQDADACDVQGEMPFAEMERLALRHQHVDGDILALFLESGQVQLIEAHRIRTPSATKRNVVNGVLLDKLRRRLEYWVTVDDIEPGRTLVAVGDTTPYAVRDDQGRRLLTHVYHPKRCTQTRGVTALAPIFDTAGQFEDIQFSALVAEQIANCFVMIRQRGPGFAPSGTDSQHGERTIDTYADGQRRLLEGFSPGMEIDAEPDEEIKGFSPTIPRPEYFPHMKLTLTLIGINLGMPLVMLLMDASETNFSGYRGALDQARRGFRSNQKRLIRRFHDPIYRFKVDQWIAENPALARAAIKLGPAIYGHVWSCPSWPYIEPLKDATAQATRVRHLLTSPRRLHAEQGVDWDDISNEVVADNALMIRRAKLAAAEINAEFPPGDAEPPVSWRDLVSLGTADQVSLAVRTTEDQAAAAAPAQQKPGAQNRIAHLTNGHA